MSVDVVENWAWLHGRVTAVAPSDRANFVRVDVAAAAIRPVEGFPNLLKATAKDQVSVLVPTGSARGVVRGASIEMRVRLSTGRRVYAHPHEVRITNEESG